MPKHLIKLNTARNCLRYIIRAYKIPEIHIPYYICPSIKNTLKKEFCKISYYHIDQHFMPVGKFKFDDFILYPNYFGICTKNVKILAKKYTNLIVDNAHAFFAEPMGLASFSSLRKFFQPHYGVNDGAYLHTEKVLDFPFKTAPDYEVDESMDYEKIVKNELRLDAQPLMYMSKTTEKVMSTVNFEQEKTWRLNNFTQYAQRFGTKNELGFRLEDGEIPFVYPYYTQDERVGYDLEKQGLLIYRYWEGLPKTFDEYQFYKYLIPVPLF